MKKIVKVAGILFGVFALTKLSDVVGQAKTLAVLTESGMTAEEFVEGMNDIDEYPVGWYAKTKIKVMLYFLNYMPKLF